MRTALAGLVATLLVLPASSEGGDIVRHSGVIVDIADDGSTFVLAEIGPWQIRNGQTVITYRTINLAPETTYARAKRAADAPSGFPGDFVEVPVGPDAVYMNDYVTVESRHEARRVVAVKVTAAQL